MTKLVWMEFINTVYGKAKTQMGTTIATMFKTLLFLWMFMAACMDESGNTMMFLGIMLLGSYLDSSVSDVVYMIPGSLEKYLYAKLKVVMGLQFGLMSAIELVRGILRITGAIHWNVWEELFVFVTFCVFIVLRSVWKFYQRYTYQQFYRDKGAGIVAILGLFFCIGVSASPEESDFVIMMAKLLVFLAYMVYTIYICWFVKKNIMLTTFFGGNEG